MGSGWGEMQRAPPKGTELVPGHIPSAQTVINNISEVNATVHARMGISLGTTIGAVNSLLSTFNTTGRILDLNLNTKKEINAYTSAYASYTTVESLAIFRGAVIEKANKNKSGKLSEEEISQRVFNAIHLASIIQAKSQPFIDEIDGTQKSKGTPEAGLIFTFKDPNDAKSNFQLFISEKNIQFSDSEIAKLKNLEGKKAIELVGKDGFIFYVRQLKDGGVGVFSSGMQTAEEQTVGDVHASIKDPNSLVVCVFAACTAVTVSSLSDMKDPIMREKAAKDAIAKIAKAAPNNSQALVKDTFGNDKAWQWIQRISNEILNAYNSYERSQIAENFMKYVGDDALNRDTIAFNQGVNKQAYGQSNEFLKDWNDKRST